MNELLRFMQIRGLEYQVGTINIADENTIRNDCALACVNWASKDPARFRIGLTA